MLTCDDCDADIIADEFENYDGQCERCARRDWERLQLWRSGERNPLFDAMFGASKPAVH